MAELDFEACYLATQGYCAASLLALNGLIAADNKNPVLQAIRRLVS